MAFELPQLSFAHSALEPHIDALTMEIHHGKHHAAYIKKANTALEGTQWADKDVCTVLANLRQIPEEKRTAVRNNAGGHANHSLFWSILSPNGGGEPSGPLAEAISRDLGSFDAFKEAFSTAGATRFGSGWAWLTVSDGKLCVCSTPNQDNPCMGAIVDCPGKPILGLDVWEHAYYLKYQNRRPDYIAAFWNIVNWGQVAENFSTASG